MVCLTLLLSTSLGKRLPFYRKGTQVTNKTITFSEHTFTVAKTLPKGSKVDSTINFVFAGFEAVLCLDKNNLWGPVYSAFEPGKTWEDAARRGIREKIGMNVEEPILAGYLDVHTNEHLVIPVTYSFVTSEVKDWKSLGTNKREVFSPSHTLDELKARGDKDILLEVYNYIIENLKNELQVTYNFITGDILENVLVTSAMTFCKDEHGQFCIVKDGSEKFYSIPGGGRSLNETPLECSKRELLEEAMVASCNEEVLGTILVNFSKDSICVSKMQQVRYLSDAGVIKEFIPYNNGFETDERLFVPFKELAVKVKQLQYPTGAAILTHLESRL